MPNLSACSKNNWTCAISFECKYSNIFLQFWAHSEYFLWSKVRSILAYPIYQFMFNKYCNPKKFKGWLLRMISGQVRISLYRECAFIRLPHILILKVDGNFNYTLHYLTINLQCCSIDGILLQFFGAPLFLQSSRMSQKSEFWYA